MAWKEGQSGNPGGRPKVDPKITKAFAAASMKAVRVLVSLLDSEDEEIRYKAANAICDRNMGKPAQAITDAGGNNIAGVVVYLPGK